MDDALVQMKATTFFTRNSPTTGAILHGDPRTNADVIARFPRVTEADAAYLEEEGLAEPYDGSLPKSRAARPKRSMSAPRAWRRSTWRPTSRLISRPASTRAAARLSSVLSMNSPAGPAPAASFLNADDSRRSPPSGDDAPPGRGSANGKSGGRRSEALRADEASRTRGRSRQGPAR
jgi:hypothetical protein